MSHKGLGLDGLGGQKTLRKSRNFRRQGIVTGTGLQLAPQGVWSAAQMGSQSGGRAAFARKKILRQTALREEGDFRTPTAHVYFGAICEFWADNTAWLVY